MINKKNKTSMKTLLDKYRLDQPIPQNIQGKMISRKKDIYQKTLKSMGTVSFFSSIMISLYFALKKIGISITLAKMIIITTALASAATGSYITINHIIKNKEQIINNNITKEKSIFIQKNKSGNNITGNRSHYPISAYKFTSTSIKNKKTLTEITSSLISKLRINKGKNYVNLFNHKNKFTSDYNVFGTMEQVENKVILTVKIVDTKTSSMVYITQEETESKEEISIISNEISNNIIKKLSELQ